MSRRVILPWTKVTGLHFLSFRVFFCLEFSAWSDHLHQNSSRIRSNYSPCYDAIKLCVTHTDKLRVVSSLRLYVIFITRVCKTCFLFTIVVSLYSCVPCISIPVFRVPSLSSFILLVYNCLHQFLKKKCFPSKQHNRNKMQPTLSERFYKSTVDKGPKALILG